MQTAQLKSTHFLQIKIPTVSNLCSEQMFKGKENHLNLIQEVRTENALQKAEQQLLREDIQLVKTLTEQQDAVRHEVEQTLTVV